jgi:SUMO ligase MMS21 Smc5/6 complex component
MDSIRALKITDLQKIWKMILKTEHKDRDRLNFKKLISNFNMLKPRNPEMCFFIDGLYSYVPDTNVKTVRTGD